MWVILMIELLTVAKLAPYERNCCVPALHTGAPNGFYYVSSK